MYEIPCVMVAANVYGMSCVLATGNMPEMLCVLATLWTGYRKCT